MKEFLAFFSLSTLFAGVLSDFQFVLQRFMAGASPAYFRALSSWAQCHVSWHNDSGQLGAGQWAVASKYLHIQPQNIQGMNFRRAFFFVYLSRSTTAEAAGRALRSQCKQINFFKIYRQVKTKYIWNLPSCNLSGGRGAIKARRLMDHHQQRCFLLSSHSHYFYLSYEIWLISPRHSGNSFELLKSGRRV